METLEWVDVKADRVGPPRFHSDKGYGDGDGSSHGSYFGDGYGFGRCGSTMVDGIYADGYGCDNGVGPGGSRADGRGHRSL